MHNKVKDFTKGNIPKKLIVFSLPFMFTNAAQIIYPVIDMAVVGKAFGGDALYSVSAAGQLFSLFSVFGAGFCAGGQIYIASLSGSGKKDELQNAALHILICSFSFSVVISAICIFADKAMLHFVGVNAQNLYAAEKYFSVISLSFVSIYLYNAVFSFFRGIGRSLSPFVITVVSLMLKIFADYVLVSKAGMQINGAAFSTLLSNIVTCFITLVYFLKINPDFLHNIRSFRLNKEHLRSIVKLGFPLALRNAAVNISMISATKIVSSLDLGVKAAFGISIRAEELLNKVSQGVTYAASSVISQNNSAGLPTRVKKAVHTVWAECLAVYIPVAMLLILFPAQFFKLFLNDASVSAYADKFVLAMLISFPSMIIIRGTNGFIQGTGKSGICFFIALLDGIIFRIGLCYLFGKICNMGYWGYFLGYTASTYAGAIPGYIYYKYKTKEVR
ncbi:MAG: MATE family efflux transporter [Clostridia bacterium]|nr:MATE family efflux transporter [Clostridia bacterium]